MASWLQYVSDETRHTAERTHSPVLHITEQGLLQRRLTDPRVICFMLVHTSPTLDTAPGTYQYH